MKHVLTAVALTGAAFLVPAPAAQAAGSCDGKIDVACNMSTCSPDYPCTPRICVLYLAPRCVV